MHIFYAHNDTLLKLLEAGSHQDLNSIADSHGNLEKLKAGQIKTAIFAIYVPESYRFGLALHKALLMVDIFWQNFHKYQSDLLPILSITDLAKVRNSGKIGGILSLEGGEALEGSLANLRNFYRLGVRGLTLTWNNRNQLADGVGEGEQAQGLSKFGLEVVEAMNQLGMFIDVSHLAEKGFWQVLKISKAPVIASHSNSRTLCAHPRNLTDIQIKALADQGGVIGVNFYPYFVKEPANEVDLVAVADQIEYLLKVGGTDSVGIGSDFDGISCVPKELEDISKIPRLIDELKKRKFSEAVIEKIIGGNFFRIIEEIFSKSS